MPENPKCPIHKDRELVCLACLGSRGGKKNYELHGDAGLRRAAEKGAKARKRIARENRKNRKTNKK